MVDALGWLAVSVATFVSTNVDDIVLLAVLFADPGLSARAVVIGQFVGIGALVAASAVVASASLVVPAGYTALLGVLPLALGLKALWALLRRTESREGELRPVARGARGQALAVAGITIANGGDNLAVYVPTFAREIELVPLHAAVFAAMTALWCFVGHRSVANRWWGARVRRYGHVAAPFVLIALGLWILADARVLLE